MNDQGMLKPALIGGVLLGILSSIPIISAFNCFCCAWVIGGGVLAAYLYVKASPLPVTLGRGAILGLVTGVIGTIANGLLSIPLYFLMNRSGAGYIDQMRQIFNQIPDIPPESRRALDSILAQEHAGLLFLISGLFFTLIIYCLFAMLGGTIGIAIFEKRKPGTSSPADQPPYQPPSNIPPAPPADAP
jgi:hypothetical protein